MFALFKRLILFINSNNRLSPEEIEKEKELVKRKREIEESKKLEIRKQKVIKKAHYAHDYYSRRMCKNRLNFFGTHQLYFELKMCQNPYYSNIISEIMVKCEFCGVPAGSVSVYMGDTLNKDNSWLRLSSLGITEEDLKI